MQLRDERYLALLRATERKYALPKAEQERRDAEEIRNLRLALDGKEYTIRLGPFRKLTTWAQRMHETQHLFERLNPEVCHLYVNVRPTASGGDFRVG